MKSVWIFTVLFLSLIIEVTLFRLPGITAYAPNLLVFSLVMIGILRGPRAGLFWAIVIGLIEDIDYGTFLGETAFAYAIVGYLSGYLRSLVLRESMLLGILLTGLGTELFSWMTFATSRFFGQATLSLSSVIHASSRSSLSTMALCILLYIPFRRIFAKKTRVNYDDESMEA